MKIVLIAFIVVVAIIALMAIIGALLPRQHVTSRAATFRTPGDALWATLTDFAALPSWAPEMIKVERIADQNGHPVWHHHGKQWSAPMEVVEFSPPHRFTLKIADPKLPFGGTWTYDIAPREGGTVVMITENGEVGPPIMRFLSRFVFGQTSTMDAYLKALGSKYGETVTPGPGVPGEVIVAERKNAKASKPAPQVGYSKRSRIDKLGVKAGMRVAVVDLVDPTFMRELHTATDNVFSGPPRSNTDMILFAVDGPAPLKRLTALRKAIAPDGVIWVIWPKGQPHIKEDTIRAAAITQGLVDIKVMAFSETLSGLKLVIPLAKR